jgi:predicted GNAT family N-acyltransferase
MIQSIAVTRDLATCLAVRRKVFIDEQGVSEADEVDGLDPVALHLLAMQDAAPVGTARILVEGAVGKIGRVCVLSQARGTGLGAALIRAAVAELRAMPGVAKAKLGAQVHALVFYERLGFEAVGQVYMDAGIPHRDMVMAL